MIGWCRLPIECRRIEALDVRDQRRLIGLPDREVGMEAGGNGHHYIITILHTERVGKCAITRSYGSSKCKLVRITSTGQVTADQLQGHTRLALREERPREQSPKPVGGKLRLRLSENISFERAEVREHQRKPPAHHVAGPLRPVENLPGRHLEVG